MTDQKNAHETTQAVASQRHQSEGVESVGRLAGGVAHDFNNLLTMVTGHTHRVLEQLPPNDPLRDDIGAVLDAATRGAWITRQLLTYAGRDVVHPWPSTPRRQSPRWPGGCRRPPVAGLRVASRLRYHRRRRTRAC